MCISYRTKSSANCKHFASCSYFSTYFASFRTLLKIYDGALLLYQTLRKKCLYSEFFWPSFSPHFPAFGLNTERYGVSLRNSVRMRENRDQNNSEYGHFLSSFCEFNSYLVIAMCTIVK